MTTQHTPGPWHWADDKGYKWGRRGLEPNVMCGTVEGLIDVDAADALLMAASPDLLAALENMVSHFPHWAAQIDMKQIDRDAIGMARAAIAKATGETA